MERVGVERRAGEGGREREAKCGGGWGVAADIGAVEGMRGGGSGTGMVRLAAVVGKWRDGREGSW